MDPYYHFKPIKNLIADIEPISLIALASDKLRNIENKSPMDYGGWNPWYLLLLIRWAFEYGGQNRTNKRADKKILTKLVSKIYNFEGKVGSFFLNAEKPRDIPKFLRTMAFQQFWLQEKVTKWDFSRSYILFCKDINSTDFNDKFFQYNNITIQEFFYLSLYFWTWLINNDDILFSPSDILNNVNYPESSINKYFLIGSLKYENVKEYLKYSPYLVKRPHLQFREQSPLIKYPFLDLIKKYLIYSRKVFEQYFVNYPYGQLKEKQKSKFAEKFAKTFERYIRKGLDILNIEYYDEDELKRMIYNTMYTDFLIKFDNCTVFLEAKAIEMRPVVKVFPADKPLKNELRDNVIKAVKQYISLINKIDADQILYDKFGSDKYYLMVISYKNLYLGPGQDMWDEFLKDDISKYMVENNMNADLIQPNRIITMSINEFDHMIGCIAENYCEIPELLENIEQDNMKIETKKMQVMQHLDDIAKGEPRLRYLDDTFDEVVDELKFMIK